MIVDCALYEDGMRRVGTLALDKAATARTGENAFVWIGLYEPTAEEFDSVRREFALHDLAVEDAIHAHQRPKLEIYGDSVFFVLKTARYLEVEETVECGEILVFVGAGFIVVVRHGEASALAEVRRAVEARPALLACGPSAVLHAIVDHVVDGYSPVLAGLENDIQEVESEVFSAERTNPAEQIYKLEREVLDLYRAVAPLLEAVDEIDEGRFEAIPGELHDYFRDVHDHLLRFMEQVDTFRDLLTSVLEANLTRVSVRQNEDMRRISAWVAIAAVPTMVAGIYGMNFDSMPELGWDVGYPLTLGIMLTACVLMYRAFRRSGWL